MPKLSTREVTAIANAFYDLRAYAAITSDYPTATVAAEINEQRLMSTRTMKQMQMAFPHLKLGAEEEVDEV